ncbi:hypothetical protein D9M71_693280 [compost metagenome]
MIARAHRKQAIDVTPVPMVVIDLVLALEESDRTSCRILTFTGTFPAIPGSELLHRLICHVIRELSKRTLAGKTDEQHVDQSAYQAAGTCDHVVVFVALYAFERELVPDALL